MTGANGRLGRSLIRAVAGRRAKKQAKANAKAQAEQQVNAETQKKIDAVKTGMGACLTSKGYTVQ